MIPILYARKEPAGGTAVGIAPPKMNVHFYKDALGFEEYANCPWYYSNCPNGRYRYYTLNGVRYRLKWLPPLKARKK